MNENQKPTVRRTATRVAPIKPNTAHTAEVPKQMPGAIPPVHAHESEDKIPLDRNFHPVSARKVKKPSRSKTVVLRALLVLATVLLIAILLLISVCAMIFRGPSENACARLTMSMVESSGMKWVPGLFIGQDKVDAIKGTKDGDPTSDDITDTDLIVINRDIIGSNTTVKDGEQGTGNIWEGHPDGIVIETVAGDTYNAHVMLIRDPSKVYLATSTTEFSMSKIGSRITTQIEADKAIAAINGGGFFDDGTASPQVGSVPIGMTVSKGKILWTEGKYDAFMGFTEDNILVVARSMSVEKVKQLKIRDGCCFGPVLIINGEVQEHYYNAYSGYNPRTAIGQRADGTVIFLCIDGRQAGSIGASYADIIDIMVEYGAVNACNLDGGSSSVMLYRDNYGLYGEKGAIVKVNSYSLLQEKPRKMPTYFMVRPD